MDDELKAEIARMRAAPPDPAVEATSKFLHSYCSDWDTFDQIRMDIRRMVASNQRTLIAGRTGLETLLHHTSIEPGLLAYLVAVDANKGLKDPSDQGAREWLNSLLQILREEIR